ncbi:MAG TPA: nucleotidyltransferase domain-containing protein [Solirubrobacterales bacterium]|nr:nucleotidyltransferase domain-containing protein [Solirubrobacterales bacterium]
MLDRDFDRQWKARVLEDRKRTVRLLTASLRELSDSVVERATAAGARAVALTGSTARGRRTPISDLDFHVVGASPVLHGLPGEVDVVADSFERFHRRLAEGDDFVQWTVRLGCVLHDPDRIFQSTYARIVRQGLWPDPRRKFERADALASLAERVIGIEDREAGQENIRGALTSYARGILLVEGVFPLARDELAKQLVERGRAETGRWLHRTIHDDLTLDELRHALRHLTQGSSEQSERRSRTAQHVADAA